ncbi:hypothetical protein [Subtercola sp. RTI3]|uniref:hypothetical protein n=1 Tax=Subtercola sp. RTI3 TaxID=3048639 RepID=UPI002B23D047|nr:hypothetical protein [Subtercola sp. RTI3]MEA9987040.1 hypothetical protein [Subtercola sp. RTI3]
MTDRTEPHAVYAPTPWSDGVWFMAHDGRCLGWVRWYSDGEHEFFGVYSYGCDQQGLRVWLSSHESLAGAAAWMGANVGQLLERSRRLGPDPVNPLGLHERRR